MRDALKGLVYSTEQDIPVEHIDAGVDKLEIDDKLDDIDEYTELFTLAVKRLPDKTTVVRIV